MNPFLCLFASCCALASVWFGGTAYAQVSVNPFASAEALRAERGAAPNATYRARYEITGGDTSGVTIEAADNWALVEMAGSARLYDFRLGRILVLLRADNAFVAQDQIVGVAFRVMERQNRNYLSAITSIAGNAAELPDGCDAETELGIVIPSLSDTGTTELRRSGRTQSLKCNGRALGSFETSDGVAPPRAFWPALAVAMPMHPALRAALIESAQTPRRIEAHYRGGAATPTNVTWRLLAAETINAPYPLDADDANVTAQAMSSQTAPDLGELAAAAVAGTALDGVPTTESWGAYVARVNATEGPAAAGLLLSPTTNTFPELGRSCLAGDRNAACAPIMNLRALMQADSAVRAMMDILTAEQTGNYAAAVPAMQRAQSSRFAGHPALGASYALALVGGGAAVQQQAQAAGLPSDPNVLQIAALRAYPYNPAYWTDFGDQFATNYDYVTAYWLYDVAASLSVPGARQGPPRGKQEFSERIRRDFPAFFLTPQ
jgi:hypothetical protein